MYCLRPLYEPFCIFIVQILLVHSIFCISLIIHTLFPLCTFFGRFETIFFTFQIWNHQENLNNAQDWIADATQIFWLFTADSDMKLSVEAAAGGERGYSCWILHSFHFFLRFHTPYRVLVFTGKLTDTYIHIQWMLFTAKIGPPVFRASFCSAETYQIWTGMFHVDYSSAKE